MNQPASAWRRIPALLAAALPGWACAQDGAPATSTTIVVVGTRLPERPFDVPASIDRIGGDEIREHRLQVNISEVLGAVPGLVARDRQNFAQDVQLSVRGFGARASFGIRGVRLYVDGIPATLPDGQGQISHADLATAERIDVLRGPFSALYGNSSGGVIEVTTAEGRGAPRIAGGVAAGSDGVLRGNVVAQGAAGAWGWTAGLGRFSTEGHRVHSAARREHANAKLTWRPEGGASKLTVVVNRMALPEAQDPLGLTRAQFDADPRGVDPVALAFDTRKRVDQTQLGAHYEHRLGADQRLQLMAYGGTRDTEQFQAIPAGPQASPTHAGGVIDLGRRYRGLDLRWTLDRRGAGRPFALVAGIAYDALAEHRRGWQNFDGATLGVKGALRRDERNRSTALDPYLQATLRPAPQWRVDAGVRHSRITVRSSDRYIAGANGDDSSGTAFSATTPVASVLYRAGEALNLYASAGRGFETPTLNELAYRADGSAGLNTALRPARSDNVEIGAKARLGERHAVSVAAFAVRTDDEIVTRANVGGRASFQNAGRTRRDGVELSGSAQFGGHGTARAALTWLDARYDERFFACAATPCSTPTLPIPAGNRLPGVPRTTAFAALQWAPPQGWQAGFELRAVGKVQVNDANTEQAAAFTVASASVGWRLQQGGWSLGGFVRVDNLFDKRHAGSVIVNEGNGRFFEPAPGRSGLAGINAGVAF